MTPLLICCASGKQQAIELPEIEFPSFPIDIDDESIKFEAIDSDTLKITWTQEGREVTIPLWFWTDLVEYAVDVGASYKKYKSLQEIYNERQ